MEPYLYRGTEASEASSNKIARYHIQICVYDTEAYLAKIENLEYETHGNWIFSIFLRVDSLKKKCLSLEYLWWFFEICPGAINPEEFLLSNVRIVHWSVSDHLNYCLTPYTIRSTTYLWLFSCRTPFHEFCTLWQCCAALLSNVHVSPGAAGTANQGWEQ